MCVCVCECVCVCVGGRRGEGQLCVYVCVWGGVAHYCPSSTTRVVGAGHGSGACE